METVVDKYTPEGARFMKELRELDKLQVRVGFQRGKAVEEDGKDLCDIVAWNELGTSNGIKPRPFLRDSVDKHTRELNAFMEDQVDLLIRGVSAAQVLKNCGEYQKAGVQREITDGKFVKNKDSTSRRKHSDHPLIDTGRMRQSVNYVICQKGEYD